MVYRHGYTRDDPSTMTVLARPGESRWILNCAPP